MNAFGIWQAYYQEHLLAGCSSDQIVWIGSVQLFLVSIGASVVGPLFDMYGARSLEISGIILHFLALILTSLSREYYQILLAHGILFGIASCLVYFPALTAVSQTLGRHTGLGLGCMYAGATVGGIFWTEIWRLMLIRMGFAWAMRTAAFISLGFLLPGSYLVTSQCTDKQKQTLTLSLNEFVSCAKDAPYILIAVGTMVANWGLTLPTFFLVLFGRDSGMSEGDADRLMTWLNLGSLTGLPITGALADKLGRFNLMSFSALTCGLLSFDCIEPLKSRLKLYSSQNNIVWSKVEEIWTLGARLNSPTVSKGLEYLKELWQLTRLAEGHRDFPGGFDNEGLDFHPDVHGASDQRVIRGIAQFLDNIGLSNFGHNYESTVEHYFPELDISPPKRVNSWISFTYTKRTGVYLSVYYHSSLDYPRSREEEIGN
ncbi:hypothetical protein CDV55_102349 [Aspergillus turcosus]|nr:hypothetical protein CDV55_102349 [Aspergillus turcosus]